LSVVLPELTEADPEVAGEGSLDPMGLGIVTERLGDQLLPGITNRMRRPRLLTAMAVGALAGEGLDETVPPLDGRSTPSICMEWLMLEAYVRRRHLLPPDGLAGVPGSAKVEAVVRKNQHLTVGNYLKTANVFGFTGVLMPLARSTGVLDASRRSAHRTEELVGLWEKEQGLDGFVDNHAGSDGGNLRRAIRDHIRRSLQVGHSVAIAGSPLLGQLTKALGPRQAGPRERKWIECALRDPSDEIRAEIAKLTVETRPSEEGAVTDLELLHLIRPKASPQVVLRLDAVVAYEAVTTRLQAGFDIWRCESTQRGTSPLGTAEAASKPGMRLIAKTLRPAIEKARVAFDQLGGSIVTELESVVESFDGVTAATELAENIIIRHELVQARKPPRGKRPWFERDGGGLVVRPLYRLSEPPADTYDHFGRLYRLSTFAGLLSDLR
jgi:hypothetical protein